jgi:hypothetical protein
MSTVFFILAIISVIIGVVASVMIAVFLTQRGTKINYLFFRLFVFKYIEQYRRITINENGRPGTLFYSYVVSMILALVFAVTGIILKTTG